MRARVDTSAVMSFLAAADEVAAGRSDPGIAWAGYENDHAAVFASYLDGFATAAHRPPAAAGMVATAARVRASGTGWEALVGAAAAAFPDAGPVEVAVVVFVGMGTSNGWVAPLDGRRTVFLAVELAPPSPLDRVLVAHELTHAVHGSADLAWVSDDYPIGAHVFSEGLATYRSTLDVPGRRDGEYLWFDSTHQQWVEDCDRGWAAAAAALTRVLDDPCGGPAERRFFGLRPAGDHADVPVRFGYDAGLRLVRELADTATVPELLAVDVATARQLIRGRLDRHR